MADNEAPLVSFHFGIEVQGVLQGLFREASGLTSENEKVEYKASGPKGEALTLYQPGRLKFPNVVLKRGVTSSMDMWSWRKQIEDGKWKDAQKNGSIILYDQTHAEVARWNFTGAWPTKVESAGVNSNSNEVLIETIELSVNKLERVK